MPAELLYCREKVHYRKLIAPIVQMSSRHEDANQKVSISRNPFFLFIVGSVKFMSKTEIIGPEKTLTISRPKIEKNYFMANNLKTVKKYSIVDL